jgi:hypothetical protein
MRAAEKCANEPSIQLLEDGHLYTTYSIAKIAGYTDQRLLTLTYYSQYPDVDEEYDAAKGSVRYFFVPWYWAWHNKINGILHSLHGGDQSTIDQRRTAIKTALATSIKDPDQDWLSGLLIHAYGDAYVHTRGEYGSGHEKAYGVWFGHAWENMIGSTPDGIKNSVTEPKYLAYVNELYHTLSVQSVPSLPNLRLLEEFKEKVKQMSCGPGECPILQAVPNSDSAANMDRIANFADCMKKARRLKPSEVEVAMSRIKRD